MSSKWHNTLKDEFFDMFRHLSDSALFEMLWIADGTISACRNVIQDMRPSDAGDQFVYVGGMNNVESARDELAAWDAARINNANDEDEDV